MSRDAFKTVNFRPQSVVLLHLATQIINAYQTQGYRLTLRQLYYQLVVRNVIPNTERSYKNLGNLISEGRLAGEIDWDAIEDRIRIPRRHAEWSDPGSAMDALLRQYRLPRWSDQPHHVEVWVEKDALAGVLQPVTDRRHVYLMVNRGYSSQSAMHDAYERFMQATREGKEVVVLYLGDLDPSGEDMVRDIDDRLNDLFGVPVRVIKLGITPEQVLQYNPPPNPAKMTDSRAAKFVDRHGAQSYEVDALPPDVLTALIETAIDDYEDSALMGVWLEKEERHKKMLEEARDDIMKRLAEEDQDKEDSDGDNL